MEVPNALGEGCFVGSICREEIKGDTMLENDLLLSFPTEYDLPDSDGKPVDNELQILAPGLLRAILTLIWADREDWFFGINLGVYYNVKKPAVGPDGFLSLGVPRVRPDNELRLSYLVRQEKVMPQWVLEVVSKEPGGEYDEKMRIYTEMGVLYYTIYNPGHGDRDGHGMFEVYKLENGLYVRQLGNPVWMPEIGLGIGHEVRKQEGATRDWLYWYDDLGQRYEGPEDALAQERLLREREQLIRRELEEQLEQGSLARMQVQEQLKQEALARMQVQEQLEQETLVRRSLVLRPLTRKLGAIDAGTLAQIDTLSIEQLESLSEDFLDFETIGDLTTWLDKLS